MKIKGALEIMTTLTLAFCHGSCSQTLRTFKDSVCQAGKAPPMMVCLPFVGTQGFRGKELGWEVSVCLGQGVSLGYVYFGDEKALEFEFLVCVQN